MMAQNIHEYVKYITVRNQSCFNYTKLQVRLLILRPLPSRTDVRTSMTTGVYYDILRDSGSPVKCMQLTFVRP